MRYIVINGRIVEEPTESDLAPCPVSSEEEDAALAQDALVREYEEGRVG